jgi:competence/damage-inducible protein CinA-like protein
LSDQPRAFILITGSELVRGGLRDDNGPFLARELTALGVEPSRLVTVGDRIEELSDALGEGLLADLCVISGGLGPTHDDRTVELLAAAAGRPLVVDRRLEREIEAVSRRGAERLGRPYADFALGVRKQASLPEGAVSLGLAGTAPAVLLERDGRVAVALPGPPGELRRLWPAALESEPVRRVLARASRREHRVVRFFGPSESAVARALLEAGGERPGLDVTVCARALEIEVDLFATQERGADADALVQELGRRFGDQLFAADDERPVAEIVLDLCREQSLGLATAESCTGGLVGAWITAVPGSSDVYVGGLIAYADAVKARDLGVPADVLERHGAVSAATARAMAVGARTSFAADVTVSVTGIAGPGGGTAEKPVGLVFAHAAGPTGELPLRMELPGGREDVRERATIAALHLVRRLLTQSGDTRA